MTKARNVPRSGNPSPKNDPLQVKNSLAQSERARKNPHRHTWNSYGMHKPTKLAPKKLAPKSVTAHARYLSDQFGDES